MDSGGGGNLRISRFHHRDVSQLGKRMEENLELLRQIEAAKTSKKGVSKRIKEQQRECDQANAVYQSIVDDIKSLSCRYDQASGQLRKTSEEVCMHAILSEVILHLDL